MAATGPPRYDRHRHCSRDSDFLSPQIGVLAHLNYRTCTFSFQSCYANTNMIPQRPNLGHVALLIIRLFTKFQFKLSIIQIKNQIL